MITRDASKILVAVDLDGVVFEFIKPFIGFMNTYFGTNVDITKMKGWGTCASNGLCSQETEDEAFQAFLEEGCFLRLPVVPGARKHLFRLLRSSFYKELFSFFFLTSRPQVAAFDTVQSLRQLGFEDVPVILLGEKEKKCDVMAIYGARILIDDKPQTHDEVKAMNPDIGTCLFNYEEHYQHDPESLSNVDWITTAWWQIAPVLLQYYNNHFSAQVISPIDPSAKLSVNLFEGRNQYVFEH